MLDFRRSITISFFIFALLYSGVSATLNSGVTTHSGASYTICGSTSGLLVENLTDNFSTSTNTYSITGTYRNTLSTGTIREVGEAWACKCKEANGNISGKCYGSWPTTDAPTDTSTPYNSLMGCSKIADVNFSLSPAQTQAISYSVKHDSPAACGSFQLVIISRWPNASGQQQGEAPTTSLTFPTSSYSCTSDDWYHVIGTYNSGVACDAKCFNLNINGGKSLTITPGQASAASLSIQLSSLQSSLSSSDIQVTSGFGSVSNVSATGATWTLTPQEASALQAGQSGTIKVAIGGEESTACTVNLSVSSSGSITPVITPDLSATTFPTVEVTPDINSEPIITPPTDPYGSNNQSTGNITTLPKTGFISYQFIYISIALIIVGIIIYKFKFGDPKYAISENERVKIVIRSE